MKKQLKSGNIGILKKDVADFYLELFDERDFVSFERIKVSKDDVTIFILNPLPKPEYIKRKVVMHIKALQIKNDRNVFSVILNTQSKSIVCKMSDLGFQNFIWK
jgi:hypothetical protein